MKSFLSACFLVHISIITYGSTKKNANLASSDNLPPVMGGNTPKVEISPLLTVTAAEKKYAVGIRVKYINNLMGI